MRFVHRTSIWDTSKVLLAKGSNISTTTILAQYTLLLNIEINLEGAPKTKQLVLRTCDQKQCDQGENKWWTFCKSIRQHHCTVVGFKLKGPF